LPEEAASHTSDYIASRLSEASEAKAEREGDREELAVIDHGEGHTPAGSVAGSGGRGIF